MRKLYWLDDEAWSRTCRAVGAVRGGATITGSSPGLSICFNRVRAGATAPPSTGRTRRSTTGSTAGAGRVSGTTSSRP